MTTLKNIVVYLEHLIKKMDDMTMKEGIFRQIHSITEHLVATRGRGGANEVNLSQPTDTQRDIEVELFFG
nr:uncharacterized protein LOC109179738 isoform X1 [Ipomoea batatas]